jgi:5S rRNA maturation endonuclease (ribonuclease M5)
MTSPLAVVLDRLATVGRPAKRTGSYWMAVCPAHDDSTPSLSISEGAEQRVLLKCHAGCTLVQIITVLGLELTDLFPQSERSITSGGLGDMTASYVYTDVDGQPILRVNRFHPKTFRQQRWEGTRWVSGGVKQSPLFHLPNVLTAIAADAPRIYVVEGEKDVLALEAVGAVATCNAGGAGKFQQHHAAQLIGAQLVVIVADDDEPGVDHARKVGLELTMFGVPHCVVEAASGKDAADHIAAGHDQFDFRPIDLAAPSPPAVDLIGDLLDIEKHEDGPVEHGWESVDLSLVLSDGYQPLRPSVLVRTDGLALFYSERINGLYGESGSGKSWVAMAAAAQQLTLGAGVLYLDFEDHAASVAYRMLQLGVDRDVLIDRFHYVSPNGPWTDLAGLHWEEQIGELDITLVVIDSTGEAMATDGTKPNDDDDVARWFRRIPRRLARAGACVVLLDHIPKALDSPTGFAIGSQRKRAAVDGAAYRVDVGVAPARGIEGRLSLTTVKDRGGSYQHGRKVAAISIEDSDGTVVIVVGPPDSGKPTVLMGRVCEFLLEEGVSSQRSILAGVNGNDKAIRVAIDELVDLGNLERSVAAGRGGGFRYALIRSFHESDLWPASIDSETRTAATAAEPRPADWPRLQERTAATAAEPRPADWPRLQERTAATAATTHTEVAAGPRFEPDPTAAESPNRGQDLDFDSSFL